MEMGEIIMAFLTIAAIVVAPFLAVWATEKLNENKEAKNRKLDIFRDLMATRAAILSPKHVEALNRIDIEFYGVAEVSDAWKEYHDHLSQASSIPADEKEKWETWGATKDSLLVSLLSNMATFLGYKFDNVQIKRGHYHPKAYVDQETELMSTRKALAEILNGESALKIISYMPDEQFKVLTGLQAPGESLAKQNSPK